MISAEQKKINGELRKLGFGSLDDPGLIPAIAYYIKDHEQFRGQLFSVLPDKRKLAYDQLRPHLRFQAKPLDVYEAEMKTMAEQKQWGRWNDKTHQIEPFTVGEVGEKPQLEKVAEAAIVADEPEVRCLHMICTKCTAMDQFFAPKRIEADRAATKAGWVSNGITGRVLCPNCAKEYLPTADTIH